jgi:digeranylgeranylglycerophospholipid reductase
MKNKIYDVIVIGGGPAGTTTAYETASGNLSTLLLERDREIGEPVRCAEGIMHKSLKEIGEIPSEVISDTIDLVKIVPPNKNEIVIEDTPEGVILNRNLFDKFLANRAVDAGSELMLQANVIGASYNNEEKIFSVEVEGLDSLLYSRVLIGADGIDARVGRWFNFDNHITLSDIDSCAQYLVRDENLNKGECKFIFDSELAPGGYLWVFPKGDKIANIGLGVNPKRAKMPPKEYLEIFISRNYPDSSSLRFTCGGVPVKESINELVKGRVLLVGDCAHQTNAISGGGIDTAIEAGSMCGKVIVNAFGKNGLVEKKLLKYNKEWHSKYSNKEKIEEIIKKKIVDADNVRLDRYFEFIREIPLDRLSFFGIFKAIVLKKPALFAKLSTKIFFNFMK